MSKLLRKHIAQPDFELIEERFQLVQGQVVFALLNPEQRHVRTMNMKPKIPHIARNAVKSGQERRRTIVR